MSIETWVIEKLGRPSIRIPGRTGLISVPRHEAGDVIVFCVEPSASPFTSEDLSELVAATPPVDFVLLVRRTAEDLAYREAELQGVCIGSLSELRSALDESPSVGLYRDKNQSYIRRRIEGSRSVVTTSRLGKSTYLLDRIGNLRSLIIHTMDTYEVTSDEIYETVSRSRPLQLDALVVTNPYAHDFAREAYEAARRVEISILTCNAFLDRLGESWK